MIEKKRIRLFAACTLAAMMLCSCGGTADDVLADYPYTSEVDGHPGVLVSAKDKAAMDKLMNEIEGESQSEDLSEVGEAKSTQKKGEIEIEYPEELEEDGVTIRIVDAYVSRDDSEEYTVYMSAEIVSVEADAEIVSYSAAVYDRENRYIGDVNFYFDDISKSDVGDIMNDYDYVYGSNVSRVTFTNH